jgi:uncharacterized protein (DUF1697 family)
VTSYAALLRGVNVAGKTLVMADLRRWAEAAGFSKVRTYIASGNLLLESERGEAEVKQRLESVLAREAGKRIAVFVRSAEELAAVAAANPFTDAPGNRVNAIFLDEPPPADAVDRATGRAEDEEIVLGAREIYVRYGSNGMGRSKLRIPSGDKGTARNMNTVAKLAQLAAGD